MLLFSQSLLAEFLFQVKHNHSFVIRNQCSCLGIGDGVQHQYQREVAFRSFDEPCWKLAWLEEWLTRLDKPSTLLTMAHDHHHHGSMQECSCEVGRVFETGFTLQKSKSLRCLKIRKPKNNLWSGKLTYQSLGCGCSFVITNWPIGFWRIRKSNRIEESKPSEKTAIAWSFWYRSKRHGDLRVSFLNICLDRPWRPWSRGLVVSLWFVGSCVEIFTNGIMLQWIMHEDVHAS